MLTEVHNVLLEYYQQWYNAFIYYAAGGTGDPYHMSLNSYTTFLVSRLVHLLCVQGPCVHVFVQLGGSVLCC